MTIIELRAKRSKAWEAAKAFAETHTNSNGVLSAEDTQTYERMEQEIVDLGKEIQRRERQEALDAELNMPVNKPLTSSPANAEKPKTGRASNEYKEDFGRHLRGKKPIHNVLSESVDADGGYLVPEEFERDMIQQFTIPSDRLEDIYPALHYADEVGGEGDINAWDNGIYIGTLTENWKARYGVEGHYVLIADGMQIMYIPEANRVQFRERGFMGRWDSWTVIDLCSYAVVHKEVHGESGSIGENYAWYTEPSQGLSLTGTYTVAGDFCTINGTAPLVEGWETVYYSLPCNSLFSACTVARCGSDVFTVATNTLNNVSVIEIKKVGGGALPSGTISFTLTYRYLEPEIGT